MLPSVVASVLLPLALASSLPSGSLVDRTACRLIQATISSASAVFYPGSASYVNDTERWVPNAQAEATCIVEPANPQDVSKILKVLAITKAPFGIKSGGHFADKGVSSSTGVQIALRRLNKTVYNKKTNTAQIGAGQVWNEVYSKLEPYGVNVLGGRLYGVGVSGFLLGGGYSWLTNRHGLAIDSVLEYELVLPSGEIVIVNKNSYPDLFFGLKGGYNNFGIVTKFTLPTYPQGQVWGGLITYSADVYPQLIDAVVDYQQNIVEPDAMVLVGFIGSGGNATASVIYFYNGPTLKPGVFDKFLAILSTSQDVATRSFVSLITAVSPPFLNLDHNRGYQNTIRLNDITTGMVEEVARQAKLYTSYADSSVASWVVEPFIPSSVVRSNTSATAWPHDRFLTPMSSYFFWAKEESDPVGLKAMFDSGAAIEAAAEADLQALDDVMLYGNYAAINSTLTSIYGANLPRLRRLAAKYDPTKLMTRTGGYKFQ